MAAKLILVTATFKDKVHTLSYEEWSDLTGHNINTIRKRVSMRNKQIEANKTQYTNEQIVGASPIFATIPAKSKIATKTESLIDSFHRRRLVAK